MLRRGRRGSVMVLFTLMLPTLLIPIVGLAIDASICRLMQTKLQAAVDGAAIGTGRLLGTGVDEEMVAKEFIDANFRTDGSAGTFGSFNLIKTDVHYTPGITKRIDINASADVPLLFMRILGKTKATVSAGGSATRTDTRVVFVIDRSGSMGPVMEGAKDDAAGFVQKFTTGADELGLVIYDGSAFVAYPQSNPTWDPTITATSRGGPNTGFNDPLDANNMVAQINRIQSGGQTNTSDALWLAYIELQKAHLRDLAADGHDYRMNSIVLMTDGLPQAVSIWPNNPADNAIRTGSPCVNNPATNASPTPIKGWIGVSRNGSNNFTGNGPLGLYQQGATNINRTSVYLASHGQIEEDLNPQTATSCGGLRPIPGNLGSPSVTGNTDFAKIPAIDVWGNSMRGTAYMTASYSLDASGSPQANPLATTLPFDETKVKDGRHWAISFWNAADSAASRIRQDVNLASRSGDTQNMRVTIHVLGYAGNANLDPGLCKRIANDTSSSSFDVTQPIGRYVEAKNLAELQNGFNTIFQTILRLAK